MLGITTVSVKEIVTNGVEDPVWLGRCGDEELSQLRWIEDLAWLVDKAQDITVHDV